MSTRHIICSFLMVLGCNASAQAPGADLDSTRSGVDALEHFNTVPKFLDNPGGNPPDEKAIRYQLAVHCESSSTVKCIEYIQANKQAILSDLPTNPEYWHAFHRLISGPALELDLSVGTPNDPRKDKSKLIDASYDWIYRTIASDRIGNSTDQFVSYYRNIRRQMAQSSTLIDRMIFTALVGISHTQIEMLMALHADEDDLDSIRMLADELKPFSKQETSLRKTIEGEAKYIAASIENAKELNAEDFINSEYIPTGTLKEMKQWAAQTSERELTRAIESIGELTERSWSDYWEQGFSHLEDRFSNTENTFLMSNSAYQDYARTTRSSEALVYPLLALSDMYLGISSPGLPARTAPPYWNWSWSKESQKVCLVPTHVAPGSSDFTEEYPACATYVYDD